MSDMTFEPVLIDLSDNGKIVYEWVHPEINSLLSWDKRKVRIQIVEGLSGE